MSDFVCSNLGTDGFKHSTRKGVGTICHNCATRERKQRLKREAATVSDIPTGEPVEPDLLDNDLTSTDDAPGRERQPGSLGSPPERPADVGEPDSSTRRSLVDRARALFTPPVSGPVTSPERPTRERSPAGKGPRGKGRVSAADDLGDLLASVGGFLMRTDQYQATGRMIAFQSDASGQLLDEAMAGTLVDRVAIQRAVKARKSVDGVAAIVAPPLLVWAIENDIHKQQAAERVGAVVPSRIPALVPLLEAALRQSAKVMVPAVKKVRKREADEAEALAELFPDAEPGSDPVAGLINEIFPGIYAALANAAEPHTEGVTL